MGQKVNPISFRLGITENWRSRWYATKRDFGKWLVEDSQIRAHVKKRYSGAGISRVDIERIGDTVKVIIHAGRPGMLIGKRGAHIDVLTHDLSKYASANVQIDIKEIENPEMDAQIVSRVIADQLEKRSHFKRVIKRYSDLIMDLGAEGVKIQVKGRLGGADIARSESISKGRLPLQTLRAIIDYGYTTAVIPKGALGVKVWICKGEKLVSKGTNHAVNATAD